jgi:hypothetical protein
VFAMLGVIWVYSLTCPGVLAKVAVGFEDSLEPPRPPLLFGRPLCEDTLSRSGASLPLQFKKIIAQLIKKLRFKGLSEEIDTRPPSYFILFIDRERQLF